MRINLFKTLSHFVKQVLPWAYIVLFIFGTMRPAQIIMMTVLLLAFNFAKSNVLKKHRVSVITSTILRALLIGILTVFHVQFYVLDIYTVKNLSMLNTLKPGEKIIIEKFSMGIPLPITNFTPKKYVRLHSFREPQVDDIIVFQKAKMGLLIKRIVDVDNSTAEVRGDNPNDSIDSRQFGRIKKTTILGRLLFSYTP